MNCSLRKKKFGVMSYLRKKKVGFMFYRMFQVVAVFVAMGVLLSALPGVANAELIANWRLDETSGTFADSSGNGHTATAVGVPYGDGSNGILGGAFDGDGNDHLNAGDVGNFAVTDTFSTTFWLKQDAVPTGFQWFLGREILAEGPYNDGWTLRNGGPTAREYLGFYFLDGAGGSYFYTADPVLATTDWLFIALVHNGSDDLSDTELYVNGTLQEIPSVSTPGGGFTGTGLSDADFSIGARASTGAGDVKGLMDEIGLWDSALSQEDITSLYNNGDGRLVVPEPTMLSLACCLGVLMLWIRRRKA